MRACASTPQVSRCTAGPDRVENRQRAVSGMTVPLVGIPRAQLDALAGALQHGPINTTLLQALLDGGLPGTALGEEMAHWLAARCALPACSSEEAAAWRCTLLHALRLPRAQWEVECIRERPRLSSAIAATDPFLQRLRDALYRPVDIRPAHWQAMLANERRMHGHADARQVAKAYQCSLRGRQAPEVRFASMQQQLQHLAPSASPRTQRLALRCVRQHEQRDAGLLDPRAGLPALLAASRARDNGDPNDPASGAAIHVRLAALPGEPDDDVPTRPSSAVVPPLATQLLAVAHQASVEREAALQPLGRYDNPARALVSMLSTPWQVPQMAAAGFNVAYAAAVGARLLGSTALPSADSVTNAAQAHARDAAWMQRLPVRACTPAPGQAPEPDLGPALLGRQLPGTAVALRGQCWEEQRTVPGLLREQAAAMGAFLDRQPAGPAAPTAAPTSMVASHHVRRAAVVPRHDMVDPRALAGALTDLGRSTTATHATAALLSGTNAQALEPMRRSLPLAVLAPVMDQIPARAWWDTLDWQVPRTPAGLHAAVMDIFVQAGIDLQQRAPTQAALADLFDSPPARAWYATFQTSSTLHEGARRVLAEGSHAARAYALARMLDVLTRAGHADADATSLHALARIGSATITYLQAQDDVPVAAAQAYFDGLAWRTDTVAGRLATPMTDREVDAHRARMRETYGWPLPHAADTAQMRAWLVEAQPPLLDDTEFGLLDAADTLLADLCISLRRGVDELRFGADWNWRATPPTMADWRDQLERRAAAAGSHWATELGALFHQVAASLARYDDLEPVLQAVIDPRRSDLRVLTRDLLAPILHLYSGLDLPMERADPWYHTAYPAYAAFFGWTGSVRSSEALARVDALDLAGNATRLRRLLPPVTITLPLPMAVLRHVLGHDRLPTSAPALERDLIALSSGRTSQQLVAQTLDIAAHEVTPELAHRFLRRVLGRWGGDLQRGSTWRLSPGEWLALQPGAVLAALWRDAGMSNSRRGMANAVNTALDATVESRRVQGVPTLWTRVVEGPHALDAWCASDDARRTVWQRLLRRVASGVAPSRLDREAPLSTATCAAALAASAQAQLELPEDLVGMTRSNDPRDGAPVLSLAIALRARHPALTVDEALAFGTVLLPPVARAAPVARAPMAFPLLAPPKALEMPQDAEDAALPDYALRADPAHERAPTGPDPHQLPALDVLLDAFGLSLLHPRGPADSNAAPLAAVDAWDLMSRTRPFADFCRPLLHEAGWYGGRESETASARGAQALLARLMLERYVGRTQINALRERFASPAVVDVPFTTLANEVRDAVVRDNLDASPAALEILFWMLASELQQPWLLVSGIPEWLSYAGSPLSVALLHATTFLDAMQPGACSRVDFDAVTALPAQLAIPPQRAGEHDELHDAWARALAPAAVAYASAHGAIGNGTRLDAVPAQQIADALAFVQARQRQHAQHVAQMASPAPTRMGVAAQTLREAGVEPALWSQRPADIGDDVLARHGIVPSRLISVETHALAMLEPSGAGAPPADDPWGRALITNDDSLQELLVADAYLSTSGPTTADRYATAFDVYQRRVEGGLAGLVITALEGLPSADRQLIQRAICTTLRVGCDGRQADQGLLVRCDPTDSDAASVYYELVPQAGMARRLWQDPTLGALVDFEGLVSGAAALTRDGNALTPLSGLDLTSSGVAVVGTGPDKLQRLADMAAEQLWQPLLKRVREAELAQLTGLEQRWQRERHMLNELAEFLVPGLACIEQLQAGDLSLPTLANCAMDLPVLPVGRFIGSTVRIVESLGERTIQSIAAEAGEALATLGTELVRKGGIGTLETVGKGALWAGSHAWNSALQSAGWLRRVLRTGTALEGSAQALERALAHGAADEGALLQARASTPSLAEARLADGSAVLVVAHGSAWHRYDLFSGHAYGPPLEDFTLAHDLPATIPVRRTDQGMQLAIGDTPAQFLHHGNDDWEVLIHERRYRLNAGGDALEAITAHDTPEEPGQWRQLPPRCRPRRALEMLPCPLNARLRFTPDAASSVPDDNPAAERVDGIAVATREFTLDLAHPAPDGSGPLRLMVHKGEICAWTPSPTGAAPKLVPLPAAQREALGVPVSVAYPDALSGRLSDEHRFGLRASVLDEHVARLQHTLPVVDLGALVPGIDDARRVRAIRVESPFLHALCIEPDDGVFYQAPLPGADSVGGELHFTRLQPERDAAAINVYLRAAETYRINLLRPYLEQDRENIARLAFSYIKPTLSPALAARLPTYEAYDAYFAARGRPDVLKTYADSVLTGQRQQRTFVSLARQRIPDWKPLSDAGEDERAWVAKVLNALLPATGGKGSWSGIDAAALALPNAGKPILDHLKGANLAFLEVIDEDGQCTIYVAPSGGKNARNVQLNPNPTLGDGTRFVDARSAMQGVAPLPTITSLPVVLGSDGSRVVETGAYLKPDEYLRERDSERMIASCVGSHPRARSLRLFTVLGTCDSCGGVVLPQLRERFPDASPFSVRYLQQYGAGASPGGDPMAAVAGAMEPDPDLVTYFDQWRRERGLT